MSDISSVSSNMMRITGMATGMDTDSMVKKMMAAENIRLDKMKQGRQYIQWRQDGLRDVIKDFRDLRQKYLLIDSPADTNMIKSAAYSGSSVTITDDGTNTASTAVTATALPGAVNGTSTVVVNQIAKSAKAIGDNLNSNSATISDSAKFSNQTIKFTINGKEYNAKLSTIATGISDADLQSAVNDAINNAVNSSTNAVGELTGRVTASVQGGKITFNSLTDSNIRVDASSIDDLKNLKVINPNASTLLSDLGVENGSLNIAVDSGIAAVDVDSTKTIQDLINKIYNTKVGTSSDTLYSKIKVNFSELTGNLTIETRNTGSNQTLGMTDSNNKILSGLKLSTVTPGQDAKVLITPPGATSATTVTKSTNNFTIDNMNYNLVKDPNGKAYTVNLTTKPDSQDAVKKIKAFVDQYNTLVQKISDKISEKKNYDYKPLTDDQRSSMKDDQIKSWEDKAKQGILKNDGDLQSILNSMRSAFMDGVKSAGISLSEIGIDTYGGYEAITKPGQLKIDETKLKNALETRGDQVMNIFIAAPNSSITDTKEKYNNTGIFKRIEDIIDKSAVTSDGNLLKKAGYVGTASESTNAITKQLKDQDNAIYELNKKLANKQEKYYQMFARLETAMNSMNAQQSWLTQQLGGK